MSTAVYLRCNSGHYFRDAVYCPLDGWSKEGFQDAVLATGRLVEAGKRPTIDMLRLEGIPPAVLERTIIVEFGSAHVPFQALDPAGFLIEGTWTPARKAPAELM